MSESKSRPKMCPSCGKLMGIARECPYCGADTGALGTRMKAVSRAVERAGEGHGTPATFVLLVVMTAIYIASIAFGGTQDSGGNIALLFAPTSATQTRLGAMIPSLVDAGEWWRLVTGNFLHWGVLHLLMNALAIWAMGRAYEDEVGPSQLVGLFLVSAIGGFAFSYAVGPEARVVAGASAGGFGLIGAVIGRRRLVDGNFRDRRTIQAIEVAVINMILGMAVSADNYAHFGGLVVGALIAYLQARFARQTLVWTGLAAGTVLLSGVSFALALTTTPLPDVDDVNATLTCRAKAVAAVSGDDGAPNPAAAEVADACFARLRPLGDDVDAKVKAVRVGLARAVAGRTKGSLEEERKGVAAVFTAAHELDQWVVDYAKKLGLELVDK